MSNHIGEGGDYSALQDMLADIEALQQRVYEAMSKLPLVARTQEILENEYQAGLQNSQFVSRTVEELAVTHSHAHVHSLFEQQDIYRRYVYNLHSAIVLPDPASIRAVLPHVIWAPLLLAQEKQREAVFPPAEKHEQRGFDGNGAKQHDGIVRTEITPFDNRPYGILPFFIIGGRKFDKHLAEVLLALPGRDFGYIVSKTSFFKAYMNTGQWQLIEAAQQQAAPPPEPDDLRSLRNPQTMQYELTADSPQAMKVNRPEQKVNGSTRQRKIRSLPLALTPLQIPFQIIRPAIMQEYQVMPHLENLARVFGKLDIFSKLLSEFQTQHGA